MKSSGNQVESTLFVLSLMTPSRVSREGKYGKVFSKLFCGAFLGAMLCIAGCSGGGGGAGTTGITDVPTVTTSTTVTAAHLTVVSTTPADGTTNVPVNAIAAATFSEKLAPSSLTSANFYITGVTTTLSSKCSSVFLYPIGDLSSNTSYTLTITGVKNTGGNVLETPYNCTFSTGPPVKAIAGGGNHTIALKNDGTVWTWGDIRYGITTNTAVQVSGLTNISAIAGGGNHTIALKNDGTVWTWGDNTFGQLGDGTTTQRNTPVQVSGLTNISAIAGGGIHTIALKNDGTVWTWGDNRSGQLGDGTTTQRNTPFQVSGLANVTAIAGGYYFTIALKADGTVWTWGNNAPGQFDFNGITTTRYTPFQVSGLANVTAIEGGFVFTIALKADGTVWTWGNNYKGVLGDGTTSPRYTAVQVSGLTNVYAIAGGFDHAIALKNDGTVWTWGDNTGGQLGDGTTTQRNTPGQVSGLTNVSAIAGGDNHTIALKNNGTVWEWGYNAFGGLGDGTTIQRNTPVQVKFSSSALTAPAALSGVTATETEEISKITVSWVDTPGATSYDIYYSTSSTVTPTTGTKVECVTSPYTITNLTPNVPYYTCIVASNGYGDSACSNIASATPTGVTPPIVSPPPASGNCAASPPCCSTKNGIQVTGVVVPATCSTCPSATTYAGMDNVTAGGPYKICTCNGC